MLTQEQANKVWDILVLNAGARENQRDDFVYHITRGCLEYRFCGNLGFGGKFQYSSGWKITCYKEAETEERSATIRTVNKILQRLLP